MNNRFKFGLIGKNISYSFSKKYFMDKFQKLDLTNFKYFNFDIPEIEEFPFLLYQKKEEFRGFSVTIPYKESIIKYLDGMDSNAEIIGAVNTVKVTDDNKLIGYNTDGYGFQKSIQPLLKNHHKKALILGSGGAAKASAFGLKKLGVESKFVSRKDTNEMLLYKNLTKEIIEEYTVIVNCSPIGTFPEVENAPNIPYEYITDKHLLFDLIYNPEKTKFLKQGEQRGAVVQNGYEMLTLQAEKAWEIWNS